jgi:hypothetical protein
MFRAVLAHPQEALHNPGSRQQTFYACNIRIICSAPPEDEQVVLEICAGC